MERKEFLKKCGISCLSSTVLFGFLQSCGSTKLLSGAIEDSDLIVLLSDFETKAGNEIHYKNYIVVSNDKLKYPVCIYRFDENNYSALWMRCTHQGAELQVFGDKLQCPAHGSEFDNNGKVVSSPADKPLRSFSVSIDSGRLKISLKTV